MADRKTRQEKERAEIRKLKQQNTTLQLNNTELTNKMEKILQRNKPVVNRNNAVKVFFLNMYDIIVSAIILVFVYWISINGNKSLDVLYYCFLALVILVSLKGLFDNKEFQIKKIMQVILSDLLKPFISMFLGLFLCMFCLGEKWRSAKGYALDVANMGLLILAVVCVVIAIVIFSYIFIGIKKFWIKRKNIRKRC
ncbi:MAG: hypothetical protein Q4E29_01660 [Lachnospiraceae bacterium]|nr:hypothetical protein [Lachnospiraceae bacterium]